MLHLVLFDIDGTLTDSHDVASMAYLRSAQKHFSLDTIDLDWSQYTSSTATGIALEITQKKWGRAPLASELEEIKNDVLDAVQGSSIEAIPGSVEMIKHLLNDEGYVVGIATGNFRCVAEHTLKKIGIPKDIPLTTADEHLDRTGIISLSVDKAQTHAKVQAFRAITYIGDGAWDYRAAQSLGHDFIGIGSCPKMCTLAGGRRVADFREKEALIQLLKSI